ncbi:hypothetical protein D5754_22815 [Salmonella enterica subsp. enterica serovar Saphra]|nr:hypothetical protein [Salmonella enterica subsp. enterica serovar Saphra]
MSKIDVFWHAFFSLIGRSENLQFRIFSQCSGALRSTNTICVVLSEVFYLHIVLYPCPVTRSTGAKNSGMNISSPWYTSGKS